MFDRIFHPCTTTNQWLIHYLAAIQIETVKNIADSRVFRSCPCNRTRACLNPVYYIHEQRFPCVIKADYFRVEKSRCSPEGLIRYQQFRELAADV